MEDKALATALASRIACVTQDRARGIYMIGSRALGRATLASDLDLVVLIETDATERPWSGKDAAAEADRIQREVGSPSIQTDLTVRSIDQFEEARSIIGGVEWLVVREGIQLFSSPLRRAPTPRLSASIVRRALVYAWLEAAVRSLFDGQHASNLASSRARTMGTIPSASTNRVAVIIPTASGLQQIYLRNANDRTSARYHHLRAAQKAVTALCVAHQLDTSKHDDFGTIFARLEGLEPAFVSAWGPTLIDSDLEPTKIRQIVTAVLRAALEREGMHPCVISLSQKLREIEAATARRV